jgi:branched-chain amino acid transport system substrate-binding protein
MRGIFPPKKSLLIRLIVLSLIFAGFLSCTQKKEGEIKLGFIGPLTGPAASYGIPQKNGAVLAVEEINAAGGLNGKKIEVIYEDSQMDPNNLISRQIYNDEKYIYIE